MALTEAPDIGRSRPDYDRTRDRVETFFDETATRTWERLTSDSPVSRIRQTVCEARDRMRALILSRLPADLTGARVLDAGCGAGQMSIELARRGAMAEAVDISPALIEIAARRLPRELQDRVTFRAGDMLNSGIGRFDHVIAMDSLIYYTASDIAAAIRALEPLAAACRSSGVRRRLRPVDRVSRGFYISSAMELRP